MNISPNAAKPLTIDDCVQLGLAAAKQGMAAPSFETKERALETVNLLTRLIAAKMRRPDAASV